MEAMAGAPGTRGGEDLHRRQQQQQQQWHGADGGAVDGEGGKEKENGGGGRRRPVSRHQLHHREGSWTAAFVAVDYLFLLVFFGLLCFFLLQIWRGAGGGGSAA